MQVTKSTLNFTFLRKKYEAGVSTFQPASRLMIRVHVPIVENKEQVFIYYKLKKGELFWFDMHEVFQEGMAEVIAGKLLE